MRCLLFIVLCLPFGLGAAPWPLPAANQGYWTPHTAEPSPGSTPGVGVPGGFIRFTAGQAEDRAVTGNVINVVTNPTYSADNTGAADATSAINSAIAAAASGDVVYLPAGTYRIDGSFWGDHTRDNITIRGDGLSTVIVASGSDTQTIGTFGQFNSFASFPPESSPWQTVTSAKTKGVTALTVSNSSAFSTNRPATIQVENEHDNARITAGAPPTLGGTGQAFVRKWVVMITGKPDSTTLTIDPPLLLDASEYVVQITPAVLQDRDLRYFGIESMKIIDGGGTTYKKGFSFGRAVYCWFYDLHFTYSDEGASGNCIQFEYGGFRNEVRKNTFAANPPESAIFGGTNPSFSDGAIQYVSQTSMLIEDNAFVSDLAANYVGWDVDIYSDGNVSNSVHAYNFFEQSNKNFLMNHGPAHSLLCLYEGNLGKAPQEDGYFGSTSYHTFFRNWFSGRNASGDANPSTAPGPGGVGWFNRFSRNYVLAGNVWGWDGTNSDPRPLYGLPSIGSESYNLTAQPTAGDFWDEWASYIAGGSKTTSMFDELDLDVELSFTITHNYESSLTTGAVADATTDTLPASLFRTVKPDWMGTLDLDAVKPDAPEFDYTAIPAGWRYLNGNESYLSAPSGTANVSTLNVTGALNPLP